MKKRLFFLVALIAIGSILLVGCVTPDFTKERETQGEVVAISESFTLNGVEVAVLVWQTNLDSGVGWERTYANSQWLFYPSNMITRELERKWIKIHYKLTNAAAGDLTNTKPLIQVISVEEIPKK